MSDSYGSILDSLSLSGHAMLEPFTFEQVLDIRFYLWSLPVYPDAHVPVQALREGRGLVPRDAVGDSECFCAATHDALRAPHVFERALSLTDVVGEYIGRSPPVMYSVNAFWTRPGSQPHRPDIQNLHRDPDDLRFLVLFVFLTDVGPEEAQELVGSDRCHTITGRAGTTFLADTSHQHLGRKPKIGERGIMWFRWGISDHPAANISDEITPMNAALLGDRYPTSPRLRESIQLLVTPCPLSSK